MAIQRWHDKFRGPAPWAPLKRAGFATSRGHGCQIVLPCKSVQPKAPKPFRPHSARQTGGPRLSSGAGRTSWPRQPSRDERQVRPRALHVPAGQAVLSVLEGVGFVGADGLARPWQVLAELQDLVVGGPCQEAHLGIGLALGRHVQHGPGPQALLHLQKAAGHGRRRGAGALGVGRGASACRGGQAAAGEGQEQQNGRHRGGGRCVSPWGKA
mmetsp:Transcript_97709/g.276455  ORF Transcript_97709/g.276455 Transcript_97709/m.276455 type:complete len:212 (+) Transcript_97709:42-677(+)